MYIFLVCCLSTKMWPKDIDFCRFFYDKDFRGCFAPPPSTPRNDAI